MSMAEEKNEIALERLKWLCRIYTYTSTLLGTFGILAIIEIIRMPDVLLGAVLAGTIGLYVPCAYYWIIYGRKTGKWWWL